MTANDSESDRVLLDRRRFIGATAGAALVPTTASAGSGGSDPGGNGGDGGDGGDGRGGGSAPRTEVSVTLITGETIHVTTERDRSLDDESGSGTESGDGVESDSDDDVVRTYAVDSDETTDFHVFREDEGTYVVPTDADLDVLGRELFNVDRLVDQGLTDDETDGVPVVVSARSLPEADGRIGVESTGGFTATRRLDSIGAVAGEVTKAEASASSRSMIDSDAVERVHLDAKYEALLDASTEAIDAAAAREEFDVDGSGVSVAILDTGVDADHPDFGDRVVYETDFSGDGVADGNGHGTHCAGIAAGAGTESGGDYVGVAPGADIWNVKVLDDSGSGSLSNIVAGIEHAADEGADVVSLSLGGPVQEDDPMAEAVNYARDRGVAVAVASGNSYGIDTVGSPGHAEGAITVGAIDDASGEIAGFSSGGPTPYDYRVKPDVVAPGVGITSTGSDDAGQYPYTDKSGTSMATPHVAGLSALLLDHEDRDPEAVRSALVSTATPIEDETAFLQGGGEVDADAAIDPGLMVHDAVTDFGLYGDATTDAAEITVENVGAESLDLDASATLDNAQSDEALDDNVAVTPGTLTVAPGETATLTVEVDTTDAFGYNSGFVTLDAGEESYHAVFGFVRGTAVTVEKRAHEDSTSVEGDGLWIFTDDGSVNESVTEAFGVDGTYTTTVFASPDSLNVWSWGELDGRDGNPLTMVVEESVDVGAGETVVLDESEVVPRVLDTDAVGDHAPFRTELQIAALNATLDETTLGYSYLGAGQSGLPTYYYTPVSEDDLTNAYTEYLFHSGAGSGSGITGDTAFHLLYPSFSVDAPVDSLPVDPDHLATEEFTYHSSTGSFSVSPFAYATDDTNFPGVPLTYGQSIGDRDEQTWYRTPEAAEYSESWRSAGPQIDRSTDWEPDRTGLVPEVGETITSQIDRDPLLGYLWWDIEDDHLTLSGQWHTDQSPHQFVQTNFNAWPPTEWNSAAVRFDGETVVSGRLPTQGFDAEADVEPGTEIEVEMRGNVVESLRGASTASTYSATYRPDGPSEPPEVDRIEVTGLETSNEVPAGRVAAFVDVTTPADGVDEFEAYYGPAGETDDAPFDDPSGWTAADVLYEGDGRYAVALDVSGYSGVVDLAVAATDAAGNRVEASSFGAVDVADGADAAASVDVRPDGLNPDSNQTVPVLIESTDAIDAADVAVDSVRFGDPDAVHAGEGASPIRHQRLGRGGLQVHFRADDAGYDCDAGLAAAQVVGELADGTEFSGVDLFEDVRCED